MLKKPVQKSKEMTKSYKWNASQLKWLEALESGEYKRGTGQLCEITYNSKDEITGQKYCCLGVASDLFCSKRVTNCSIMRFDGEDNFAPDKVATKLKLNNTEGLFKKEHLNKKYKINVDDNTLAQLNDAGWSFKRIAKFIRDNPEAVFRN